MSARLNFLRNPSFEDSWYHPGGIPELQIPEEWDFGYHDADTPNEIDPAPHAVFVRPEVRVLHQDQLPEHERPLFIFDGYQCVKIFKGDGSWYAWLSQVVDGEAGDYRLTIRLFADLVKEYTPAGKVWADDPQGRDGLVRVVSWGLATEWYSLMPGVKNELVFDLYLEPGTLGEMVYVEFMCPFPLASSTLFLDDWELVPSAGSLAEVLTDA